MAISNEESPIYLLHYPNSQDPVPIYRDILNGIIEIVKNGNASLILFFVF
jgi:hypothetical protein